MKPIKIIKVVFISIVLSTMVGCSKEEEIKPQEFDMNNIKISNNLANDISDVITRNVPFEDMEKVFNKYQSKMGEDVFAGNFNLQNPETKYLYTFSLDENFYLDKSTLKHSEIGVTDVKGEYTIMKYYKLDIKKTKEAKVNGYKEKDYTTDVKMDYTFDTKGLLIKFTISYN